MINSEKLKMKINNCNKQVIDNIEKEIDKRVLKSKLIYDNKVKVFVKGEYDKKIKDLVSTKYQKEGGYSKVIHTTKAGLTEFVLYF